MTGANKLVTQSMSPVTEHLDQQPEPVSDFMTVPIIGLPDGSSLTISDCVCRCAYECVKKKKTVRCVCVRVCALVCVCVFLCMSLCIRGRERGLVQMI